MSNAIAQKEIDLKMTRILTILVSYCTYRDGTWLRFEKVESPSYDVFAMEMKHRVVRMP